MSTSGVSRRSKIDGKISSGGPWRRAGEILSDRRGYILQGSGDPKSLYLRSQDFVPNVLRTYIITNQIASSGRNQDV